MVYVLLQFPYWSRSPENDQTNVPIAAIPLHVLVCFALAHILHVQMEFVVQKVTAWDGCNGTGTIEQVLHGIQEGGEICQGWAVNKGNVAFQTNLQQQCMSLHTFTFVLMLNAFASLDTLEEGMHAYEQIIKSSLLSLWQWPCWY